MTFVCLSSDRSLHSAEMSGKSRCLLFSRSSAMSRGLGCVFCAWAAAAATEACSCARMLLLLLLRLSPRPRSGLGRSPAHWAPLEVFSKGLLAPCGLRVNGFLGGNRLRPEGLWFGFEGTAKRLRLA